MKRRATTNTRASWQQRKRRKRKKPVPSLLALFGGAGVRKPSPHYFDELAKEMGLDDLTPSEIQDRPFPRALRRGPTESTLGGRVPGDLKRLTPEEFAERARRSEEFLKQRSETFPADEADE